MAPRNPEKLWLQLLKQEVDKVREKYEKSSTGERKSLLAKLHESVREYTTDEQIAAYRNLLLGAEVSLIEGVFPKIGKSARGTLLEKLGELAEIESTTESNELFEPESYYVRSAILEKTSWDPKTLDKLITVGVVNYDAATGSGGKNLNDAFAEMKGTTPAYAVIKRHYKENDDQDALTHDKYSEIDELLAGAKKLPEGTRPIYQDKEFYIVENGKEKALVDWYNAIEKRKNLEDLEEVLREDEGILDSVIGGLEGSEKTILIFHLRMGKSFKEIAKDMGYTDVNKVRGLYSTALEKASELM